MVLNKNQMMVSQVIANKDKGYICELIVGFNMSVTQASDVSGFSTDVINSVMAEYYGGPKIENPIKQTIPSRIIDVTAEDFFKNTRIPKKNAIRKGTPIRVLDTSHPMFDNVGIVMGIDKNGKFYLRKNPSYRFTESQLEEYTYKAQVNW
jgi:hypothetical protein